MGRSAKLMKRPTKAEKVSRSINTPAPSSRRSRSLSPSLGEGEVQSSIPLFNTSAKRRRAHLADFDPMSLDSSKAPSPEGTTSMNASDVEEASTSNPITTTEGKKKGKKLKDKVKAAKEIVRVTEEKSREKLTGKGRAKTKTGVLGGVDYLKLHEARTGKKKFR